VGSRHYVKQLPKKPTPPIHAMVNIDSLGLGETNIWDSRSTKRLTQLTLKMAAILKVPDTPDKIRPVDYYDSYRLISGLLALLDSQERSTH
jgi:hypothetical protein